VELLKLLMLGVGGGEGRGVRGFSLFYSVGFTPFNIMYILPSNIIAFRSSFGP
jgi:hypothetical protein